MKKIGVSYSGYYNKKYERVGHLFQDRYISEPIETEKYLLTVFRYILQNPQKAGICHAADYRWSSYRLYDNSPKFIDLSLIKTLIGDSTHYERFIADINADECMEYDTKHDDEWAKAVIKDCLKISTGTALQSYGAKERNAALLKLKEYGLSIRQIERLTGINRNIVQRA
jgi:hypothetical protein